MQEALFFPTQKSTQQQIIWFRWWWYGLKQDTEPCRKRCQWNYIHLTTSRVSIFLRTSSYFRGSKVTYRQKAPDTVPWQTQAHRSESARLDRQKLAEYH